MTTHRLSTVMDNSEETLLKDMEKSWKVARSEEVLKGGPKIESCGISCDIQAFQIGGISELLN